MSGERGGEAALRLEPHHLVRVGRVLAFGALRLALLRAQGNVTSQNLRIP